MSYFIYTGLISSLLDPRLVDPGSTLIYVGEHGPKRLRNSVKHYSPYSVFYENLCQKHFKTNKNLRNSYDTNRCI